MRIGEESLPPRFGISDLPPDSGDVTLDTCDDAIPYFVMEMRKTTEYGCWKLGREKTRDTGLRTGTDGRHERWPEREMVGLRDGQRDLAGMSDGQRER